MATPDPIEEYLSGITALRSAVEGLTSEQLRSRPIAGRWSILEVVCHLADFDAIYADRIKRIVATNRPLLTSAGHDDYAANLAYHDRDLDEELAVVEATRRSTARTLRAVGLGVLDRSGIYRTDSGSDEERTAGRLLTIITGHIPHHLKFVAEKRKAMGLPEVGAVV